MQNVSKSTESRKNIHETRKAKDPILLMVIYDKKCFIKIIKHSFIGTGRKIRVKNESPRL